ncbi:MAG: FMN-binding protein [Sphaerochaetaceae bacterium]|nr:FMN-binding protein [Sphaerochaetaceae bacterium]MDD3941441.1 FMN-binding protein [Sphaerochaetaceae bacterium]MDX9938604.1 FMN-binding protein [Sphaerochaetaceae bacterium]
MRQMARVGITLALIASIAATSLAVVNAVTAPKIAAYEQQVIENALKQVSGGFELGESTTDTGDEAIGIIHRLTGDDQKTTGYILQMTGTGYGGSMTVMASYKTDGSVIDARLLANAETPGLGKKAEVPAYMDKFKDTGADSPVPVKKNMLQKDDADSIGGATVTFSGVARAIAHGSDYVKTLGGK